MGIVERSDWCPRHWQITLTAMPAEVPDARRQVRLALRRWGWEDGAVDDIVSICSELLANAIRHGSSPDDEVDLMLRQSHGSVRVEVVDRRPDLKLPTVPVTRDEGGRGLVIVGELAERMGTTTTRTTKTVWARVALASDRTRKAQ
ncbi:ATP-binding protein [Kitasatospora purpeofusca]|uniref:ATP-binding protein n=1 Tax=Kitasatospora purpeofusca TaxID=67352 RepID=UPI00340FD5D3